MLWADGTGSPFWSPNGAEEDGVGGLCGGEGFLGERDAVGVNGALELS